MKIALTLLVAFATPAFAQMGCLEFNPPGQVGKAADSALTEISGIAASRQTPGVIWAHNDSGDVNRVFALSVSGTRLATCYLSGASAIDWEDLAIGPGPIPGQDYLYVADTGNNSLNRATVTIYRVPEPSLAGLAVGAQVNLSSVVALPIQYPNGARDVETLLVDPLTSDILLLTRDRAQTGWTDIYLYPIESQAPGQLRTVEYITSIASSVEIKGGDVSRDGLWILLRRHGPAGAPGWLFPRSGGTGIESAFNATPCLVQFASEPQGEAVAFASDLAGFYTISEGAAQPIYFSGRLTAPAAPDNGTGKAISISQVNLTWRDNANNETGFILERSSDGANFEPPLLLAANTVSYNDFGLLPGRTYWYRLAAWNNAGSSAPLLMSVKTFETAPALPAAPTSLSITSVSSTRIDLSWADNSSTEQGFKIEHSTDNRTFSLVGTTGPNVKTFANTALQPNKVYYFRVRAFNSVGNSAYSNTVSARTAKR